MRDYIRRKPPRLLVVVVIDEGKESGAEWLRLVHVRLGLVGACQAHKDAACGQVLGLWFGVLRDDSAHAVQEAATMQSSAERCVCVRVSVCELRKVIH